MRRRRRARRYLALLAALALLVALFYRFRLTPLIKELAVTEVENQASDVISDAVGAQIADGSIDYHKIITLEKNADGQITALKTNMAQVNQLRREILAQVNQRILDLNVYALAVPLGSVVAPGLLSGLGPVSYTHLDVYKRQILYFIRFLPKAQALPFEKGSPVLSRGVGDRVCLRAAFFTPAHPRARCGGGRCFCSIPAAHRAAFSPAPWRGRCGRH